MTTKYPWGHHRPINFFVNYYRNKFKHRLQKVSIDAGFTCPNRDGTVGIEGCVFCNNDGFNPSYCNQNKSITHQIEEGIKFLNNRYKRSKKYIAYFQAYSNTYSSLNKLKILYEEALKIPIIEGIAIGTRPDCIDNNILDYLQKINEKYYVKIEYGIESCYNKTLKEINRGHNFEKTIEAIEKTHKRGIPIGAHVIFGLPNESIKQMLQEAEIISKLPLQSIKFHQLQILKGTTFEKQYKKNPDKFQLFKMEDYIEFIIDFLEIFTPAITIERLSGEVPPRFLIAPNWGLVRSDQIIGKIEKRMIERNTWQGKYRSINGIQ